LNALTEFSHLSGGDWAFLFSTSTWGYIHVSYLFSFTFNFAGMYSNDHPSAICTAVQSATGITPAGLNPVSFLFATFSFLLGSIIGFDDQLNWFHELG
jgi:hypothetical protein